MEGPSKRPRLSIVPDPADTPDDADILRARAQNDSRLKSIFESIFEKYGKDFTDIGDEIDLSTGKIVVNNGHISNMHGECDPGNIFPWSFTSDVSTSSEGEVMGGVLDENDHHELNARRSIKLPSDGRDKAMIPVTLDPSHRSSPSAPTAGQMLRRQHGDGLNGNSYDADDDDNSSVDSLLGNALSVGKDPLAIAEHVSSTNAHTTPQGETSTSFEAWGTPSRDIPGSADKAWRVPDLSKGLFTPTLKKRFSKSKHVSNPVRSASPPGAGSLWALPQERRRRPNTPNKPRKKTTNSGQRRTMDSSPTVKDWKFAQPPDGSESDDPLQEDSPTPKKPSHDGDKRSGPRDLYYCSYCRLSLAQRDYVSHLQSVLESDEANNCHNFTKVRRQLASMDGTSLTPQRRVANRPIHRPKTPTLELGHGLNMGQSSSLGNNLSSKVTPDEARLIVSMRHVQGRRYKDIVNLLPGKTLYSLANWDKFHWSDRVANPPPLSKPWSQDERVKLDVLKDQKCLSWPAIQSQLPGRRRAEAEFELLRLWVRDGSKNCNLNRVSAFTEQDTSTAKEPTNGLEATLEPLYGSGWNLESEPKNKPKPFNGEGRKDAPSNRTSETESEANSGIFTNKDANDEKTDQ